MSLPPEKASELKQIIRQQLVKEGQRPFALWPNA